MIRRSHIIVWDAELSGHESIIVKEHPPLKRYVRCSWPVDVAQSQPDMILLFRRLQPHPLDIKHPLTSTSSSS